MTRSYWENDRIRLRAMEEKDLAMYIEQRNRPDSERQWFEDEILMPLSEMEMKKRFEEAMEEFQKDDKRIFIIETLDEQYVGEISVWHTNRKHGVFRYGIFLNEDFRGNRMGKQALIMVLDYYFNELNYHKASPMVYGFNHNSQAFHKHFGFILEGRSRGEIYSRGVYHDLLYFGMLKEEFNQLYKHEFFQSYTVNEAE